MHCYNGGFCLLRLSATIFTASLEKTYERPLHTVVIATVHLQSIRRIQYGSGMKENTKELTVEGLEGEITRQGGSG